MTLLPQRDFVIVLKISIARAEPVLLPRTSCLPKLFLFFQEHHTFSLKKTFPVEGAESQRLW